MDISGLSSYNDYLTQAATDKNADKMQGSLKADYSNATDDELMDVCKEFEAYFLEQVLKEMKKTIPKNEEFSNPSANLIDYAEGELMQNISKSSTEQAGLGLANMLYEQMKRNYGDAIE